MKTRRKKIGKGAQEIIIFIFSAMAWLSWLNRQHWPKSIQWVTITVWLGLLLFSLNQQMIPHRSKAAKTIKIICWLSLLSGTVISLATWEILAHFFSLNDIHWRTAILSISLFIMIVLAIIRHRRNEESFALGFGLAMPPTIYFLAGWEMANFALIGQTIILLSPIFERSFK
jgi:hypothetical protein